MAWALVSTIKDQLSSFNTLEFPLNSNVKGEIQNLESKFHKIQAMVNDAEKRQVKEKSVKRWLDRLKDVSYQIDDAVDEWKTVMIKAEIERQEKDEEEENAEEEEKAETRAAKKVSFLHSYYRTHFPHLEFAPKIEEFNKKLDEIYKRGERYAFRLSVPTEGVVERPKTTSFVDDVSNIVGRDKDREDLLILLKGEGSIEENKPHVISLVGTRGIGKTTLARLVYNDPEVKAHFNKRIWICVSDPFRTPWIAKAIIEDGNPYLSDVDSLIEEIRRLIAGKKFFLVFDDVQRWESFRYALKDGAQGSRILVTACDGRVARTIKLEILSDEDCWSVFSKIAFCDKNSEECKQLEDIGRGIVNKCKGLPLAAKTLGSLMRFKKSREEWEMILNSNMWELDNVQEGLVAPLFLSYYDLPSPLKQCFSYCGVIPRGYVFSSDELVFMWMALGYIKPEANVEMEIIAREYFGNLAIRSFFQDFKKVEDDDKIKYCEMHDIVHDFVQFMSINECCFKISHGTNFIDYQNTRHLHLKLLGNALSPYSIYWANKLRTLIFEFQGDYNLSTLFQHFRCLRILTLNCQDDDMFKQLPQAVEDLIHLRYLNLVNYCGYVLPETICNLCNLQTLKISFGIARVKKLPQGMGKLINLRHLILDCLYFGLDLEFPRGFGRLVSLRTLSHFNISGKDDSEGCKLGELKNLNHLQGALQIRRLGNVLDACEAEDAQLKKKKRLRTLFLRFDGSDCENIRNNDGLILNGLEPPPCLEYLCIEEYRATSMSTNWMMSLTNLKKLDIRYAFLEHLPPLGKLRFLESLHIDNAIYLKKVGVEFLGIESEKKKGNIMVFPSLKYLTFESLYEWKEWIGIGGEEEEEDCITIMPLLEKLTICNCELLLSLPDFLRITPLKQLVIHSCCYLSKWCKEAEWTKISHIPITEIQFTGEPHCPYNFSSSWLKPSCTTSNLF